MPLYTRYNITLLVSDSQFQLLWEKIKELSKEIPKCLEGLPIESYKHKYVITKGKYCLY